MSEYLKTTDYVNSTELARDGLLVTGKALLKDMRRLADSIEPSENEVSYKIKGIIGEKGWPGAIMKLSCTLPLICNRCNKPLDYKLDTEVVFRFAKNEQEADSIPVSLDEVEEVIVGGSKLNLMNWIEEEILLSIPMIPVHEGNCKWDKPKKSQIQEPDRPNPFAKLKELKGLRKQ